MFNVQCGAGLVSFCDGDSVFKLTDGVVVAPRAGLYITEDCPQQIKLMIADAVSNGWLKPFATMKESEYLIAKLTHNE